MTAYRIRNWEKFQHYKNRNPPWIRLYVELIDDFKRDGSENDFHALGDAEKLTLILIFILASRYGGIIPSIEPVWLAVKLGIKQPSAQGLVDKGFLIPVEGASANASKTLANQNANYAPYTESDTESDTETEGEGEGDRPTPPTENEGWSLEQCLAAAQSIGVPVPMVQDFWAHYASVGWIDGAGRKITHLAAALAKWKAKQPSHGRKADAPAWAPAGQTDEDPEAIRKRIIGGGR